MKTRANRFLFFVVSAAACLLAAGCERDVRAQPAPAAGIPYAFDRRITEVDLRGKTLRELSLVRNTIFARHGHRFTKPWLHAYFAAQPWYRERLLREQPAMTSLEIENLRMLVSFEQTVRLADLPPATDDVERQLRALRHGHLAARESLAGEPAPEDLMEAVTRRALRIDEVRELSLREMRILRNTVYARHGRPFRSPVLREYFEATDWYHADPGYRDDRLTRLDRQNVELVRSAENERGGSLTDGQMDMDTAA